LKNGEFHEVNNKKMKKNKKMGKEKNGRLKKTKWLKA